MECELAHPDWGADNSGGVPHTPGSVSVERAMF